MVLLGIMDATVGVDKGEFWVERRAGTVLGGPPGQAQLTPG